MRFGPRHNIGEVRVLPLQHRGGIRIAARNAILRRECGRASGQRIGDSYNFDTVNALPGLGLKPREEAGADHYALQGWITHSASVIIYNPLGSGVDAK